MFVFPQSLQNSWFFEIINLYPSMVPIQTIQTWSMFSGFLEGFLFCPCLLIYPVYPVKADYLPPQFDIFDLKFLSSFPFQACVDFHFNNILPLLSWCLGPKWNAPPPLHVFLHQCWTGSKRDARLEEREQRWGRSKSFWQKCQPCHFELHQWCDANKAILNLQYSSFTMVWSTMIWSILGEEPAHFIGWDDLQMCERENEPEVDHTQLQKHNRNIEIFNSLQEEKELGSRWKWNIQKGKAYFERL